MSRVYCFIVVDYIVKITTFQIYLRLYIKIIYLAGRYKILLTASS